ncbi:MAG: hypothetical protein AAGI91_01540 [Bacteroidota bacterium]
MTPRLFSILRGDAPRHVALSETGRANRAFGAALAGFYADRALLLWSVVWLGIRWARWQDLAARPAVLYEPETWLAALVFPAPPSAAAWYAAFAVCALAIAACWRRPRLVAARLVLATSVLLLMSTEFTFGKIEHTNHLFLLAHTFALFLPVGRPETVAEASLQAWTDAWYRAALLFPYMIAGLWKWVDMTVRQVLKPGLTWLHPDALPISTLYTYRIYDLPLDAPAALAPFGPVYVIGYVGIALVFAAASVAAFRRPLLPLVLLTIIAFHLTNVLTLYVHFVTTCAVALVLFFPYERVVPAIRRSLTTPTATVFDGAGAAARYRRHYANGDVDCFEGFYAYRERLADRAWLRAVPLYYPGLAALATWVLQRRQPSASQTNA